MKKHSILLAVATSSFFTLSLMAGLLIFFSQAMADSPARVVSKTSYQTSPDSLVFVSISSLAFEPISRNADYYKDLGQQKLILNNQTHNFGVDNNLFITPLFLTDQTILTGMTVFGEDFDPEGAIQIRLKRCQHGQAACLNLASVSSTDTYAAGQFETLKVTIPQEIVDNNLYSYLLELETTALAGSGLRSVRLETIDKWRDSGPPTGEVERWSLSGNVTSLPLPNLDYAQVRVCTDDLSHLNNPTHYPSLVVDEKTIPLSSNNCVTVWGQDIELRRNLNTGPSSGTYQILR